MATKLTQSSVRSDKKSKKMLVVSSDEMLNTLDTKNHINAKCQDYWIIKAVYYVQDM